MIEISRKNVGRIAERIVMNELDARGFRSTDLNKDGVSTNVDLVAAKGGRIFQVQVKGSSIKPDEKWWIGYGSATASSVARATPFFNSKEGHYVADVVVLVAVRSLKDYICIVLPTAVAEKAAQLNLDNYYRLPKGNGDERIPHRVWVHFDYCPKPRLGSAEAMANQTKLVKRQQAIFAQYRDAWDSVFSRLPQKASRKT